MPAFATTAHSQHAVFYIKPIIPLSTTTHPQLWPEIEDKPLRSGGGSVLLVNHGYPPLYNACTEIDTQTNALELRRRGGRWSTISVFSREADVLSRDYTMRSTTAKLDSTISVHLVNNPRESSYNRYACSPIDDAFRMVLRRERPAVGHFGHVNHLGCNLVKFAREAGAATVFTLHDWFLLCPRGQFLVVGPTEPHAPILEPCSSQVDEKCARRCFACRFGRGEEDEASHDVTYWTHWVGRRMAAFRTMALSVDAFTAPSVHLLTRFAAELDVPHERCHYLPYGFHLSRLAGRSHQPPMTPATQSRPFIFAFIGRHVPAKGLHLLVRAAFLVLEHDPSSLHCFRVLLFGRPDGANTESVRRLIAA